MGGACLSTWASWARMVERSGLSVPLSTTFGSSPRVRGTPNTGDIAARTVRFIPACAGNAPAH